MDFPFIENDCILNHKLGIKPNPSINHTCKYQALCIANNDFSLTNCICYTSCFDVGDSLGSEPVCGTNLKQYLTFCHLRREACTLMTDIGVKYHGLCHLTKNACTNRNWRSYVYKCP